MLFLVGLTVFGGAHQASAHASLLESTPTNGAVLTTAPQTIVLHFNEDVTVLETSALTGTNRVPFETTQPDPTTVIFTPSSPLDSGAWLLSWRVVSSDGHPIGGALRFTIENNSTGTTLDDAAGTTTPPPTGAGPDAGTVDVDWQDRALETLTWIGLVIGAAGAIVTRRSVRRGGALVVIVAGALRLLEMMDIYRGGVGQIGEARSVGLTIGAGLVLWACPGTTAVLGMAALFGLSATQSGHPLRLDPGWLYAGAHALHLATAFVWTAAVVATIVDPRQVKQASRLATISVLLLIPSATLSAAVLLRGGDLHATWDRMMVTKLVLVCMALGIGAVSRYFVTRRATHTRGLRIRSSGELVLIGAIAVLSALLTTTSPSRFVTSEPRDAPATAVGGTSEAGDIARDATLTVRFEDGSTGELHIGSDTELRGGATATMHLTLRDSAGTAFAPDQAEYVFLDETGGTAVNGMLTPGPVSQAELVIPGPGRWTVHVTITSGFEETIGETVLEIPADNQD